MVGKHKTKIKHKIIKKKEKDKRKYTLKDLNLKL